ncbi:hypothetical protein [Clostridium sp. E02]|uniref:hypothetical protein n=1 Tax=Clostridium sp. E02 TaxID=2487134 RepID=UPI000F548095|nr:hypothetical protein [Clostridium sp. E02]
MKRDGTKDRQKRSRRRKGSRKRELFMEITTTMCGLLLLIFAVTGGYYGYQYWQGSKSIQNPSETSREVISETMGSLP